MTKTGDHYWVLAHVTPSYDLDGAIIGYHSTRRVPNPDTVQNVIVPLYRELSQIEANASNPKHGMQASFDRLVALLTEKQTEYDEFVSALSRAA